jgi:hypothetical protein
MGDIVTGLAAVGNALWDLLATVLAPGLSRFNLVVLAIVTGAAIIAGALAERRGRGFSRAYFLTWALGCLFVALPVILLRS